MLSAEAGRAAYEAICSAVRDALADQVAGIATAPVNKLAFARAGLPWKGHTDLLGHLTGSGRVAMMFWSEPLKVVLATVHVPLADVPRVLTRELLDDVHRLTAASCRVSASTSPASGSPASIPMREKTGCLATDDERAAPRGGRGARARGAHRGPVSR